MKKKLVCIFSLLLISCSQPMLNNNTGQYSDLDQEYSQFTTKALTQSYLKKKIDKWLSSPTYSKNLVREIEYAKFKHKDILKDIVTLEPTIFNSITANTGVTQKRTEPSFDNYIQYINPFPSAVIANTATNITNTSFTANWNSVNKATGYKLYLDGSATPIILGNVTSYDFTGLTGGSSHSYYVKAINSAGESSNSNTVNTTLLPSSSVATSATSITTTSFIANWGTVTGATSYTLFIDGVSSYTGTNLTYTKTALTASSSHSYYVVVTNASGNSANSNTVNVSTITLAPVASAATSITTSSFIANWATVTGATSYTLFIDGVSSYTGTNLTYTKTGLVASSSHSYYVVASNAGGNSANSNTINVTLTSAIPNAPVATSATSIGQSSLTANWNSVSNANSYKLYVDGTNVYNGTALTYTKTGLTSGVNHTYYVIAVGDGGNSANSNTITTLLIPANPTVNTATDITATGFMANWYSVTGATSYTLYVDGINLYNGTSIRCSIGGLTLNTSHTYYVTATNGAGTSGNSGTTTVLATTPPVTSAATSVTTNSFIAHWSAFTGATDYLLYLDGSPYTYVGNTTSYTIQYLEEGSTHSYYVQAVNAVGNTSASSNTTNVALIPTIPGADYPTNIAATSFTANWYAATGATSYTLYIDGVSAYTGAATSYTKTGLTGGSSHTYYVKATNASGSSGNSDTMSLVTLVAAPAITAATNLTSTSFNANWNAVTGAVSYNLYVDYNLVYQGTTKTFNVTGMTPDSKPEYYVEAVNSNGDVTPSTVATVTMKGWISCKVYRDAGYTSDGEYYINPDNSAVTPDIDAYCNMSIDGGGWTMVVAQFEQDPVKNWNEGIQADYDPSLTYGTGFALSTGQLPIDRAQTGFGVNLNPTFVDYVTFTYSTANISKTLVTGSYGNKYHIHRSASGYYSAHDPDSTNTGNATISNNTLTFDQTPGANYTWAFSPNHTTPASRGYALYGADFSYDSSNAWTVWVR